MYFAGSRSENYYAAAIQEAINNVAAHAYHSGEQKKWWVKCTYIEEENQLFLVIYDRGIGIPNTFRVDESNDINDLDNNENSDVLVEYFKKMHKDGDTDLSALYRKGYIKPKNYFNINWNNIRELNEECFNNLQFEVTEKFNSMLKPENEHALFQKDEEKIFLSMIYGYTRRTGKDERKHGQGSKSIKSLVRSNENGILWIYSNRGVVKYGGKYPHGAPFGLRLPIKGTLIQWNIQVESK